MEGDSMHSSIGRASKTIHINNKLSDWTLPWQMVKKPGIDHGLIDFECYDFM